MKQRLRDFIYMTVGTGMMSVGIYFFKIPNGFSTGGVSGLSTVLGGIFSSITPGELIFVINALLLILGFAVLGRSTGIRTVYCSLLFSSLVWLGERVVPLDVPLTDQPLLELIYAILLTSIGSAILFNCHASSGGTDIIALILKKMTSLDVGTALFVSDVLIAASSFFVFGIRTGLYSVLGLFAKSFLVDGVIESLNQCKSFLIITDNPEPAVSYIINTMGHSATTFEGVGEYAHTRRRIIITLCRRFEAPALKRKMREIDPHAFIIVTTTSEIVGHGFGGE